MIFDVTKENFESEVLNAKLPVIVDFATEWCGPCQLIAPILEEISKDYFGKVKVCKINADTDLELCAKYKILSIPVMLLFKKGEKVKEIAGYVKKEDIISIFELDEL